MRPPAQEARAVATLSTGSACIERQGVTCRRCAEACSHDAIRILSREKLGAVIDPATCTGCGDCVALCPVGAIALSPRARTEVTREIARLVAHG